MRDIDKEMDAVEKALSAEHSTIGPISKTVIGRVVIWLVIALVVLFVLGSFWK
jgi:hypothetical protein